MDYPYEEFYSQSPTWDTRVGNGPQVKICCAVHGEKTPSLNINLETGEWYCFGLCDKGGNPNTFADLNGMERPDVDPERKTPPPRKSKEPPPISALKVEQMHQTLINSPRDLGVLERTCGITLATVERFKIGLEGRRYAFPVYDDERICRNIRLYLYGGDSTNKVLHYSEGEGLNRVTYGGARLFPLQSILDSKEDYVLLCEGEKDALNACQLGFPAVTVTSGAGSWDEKLNVHFKNKNVYIMYDVDEKGAKGAAKIQQLLKRVARTVQVLSIPKEGLPDNGDLTDWIFAGATRDDIATLITATRKDDSVQRISNLSAVGNPQFNDRLVEVEAHVVGRETTSFTALRGQRLACPQSRGKACTGCSLEANDGEMEVVVGPDDKELLYLVERTDGQVRKFIEERYVINVCHLWESEPLLALKSQVEKVLLSTTVDQRAWGEDEGGEFTQQIAYVVDSHLESNQAYTVTGRAVGHPQNQSNTLILTGARSTRLSIDTFEVTPELHERLKFFQPTDPGDPSSILARLHVRWDDLAANITKIYRRPRVHAAFDLVSHSLLRFKAWGQPVPRGWVEGYVGGDTRQGKSVVAQALHNHYRAGEFVVLEVASLSGILGGAQKLGNGEFLVSWGKAPINDRGMITLDECQNIPLPVMASLSGMRSSGIAELDKIKQEKVYARTRMLWLSNPRQDGVTVDQLSQGVLLVPDVFGRPEDQARLDFATIVRANDVDVYEALRASDADGTSHEHTQELCHALLMFAWSRNQNKVLLSAATEKKALNLAEQLSKKYDGSLPLVEPAEQRIKLVRLAASVAALCYSTTDGEIITVTPAHVEVACRLLEWFLDDSACGYDEYSEQAKAANVLSNRPSLIAWCKKQPEALVHGILAMPDVRLIDVQNLTGLDKEHAQTMFTFLLQHRCLVRSGMVYVKSRAFVSLLKESVRNGWFQANREEHAEHSERETQAIEY